MINYLPGIAILILIVTGLIEIILSAKWSKIYFKFGYPVIIKKIPVEAHHTNIPSCIIFEKKFKSNWFDFYPSLIFKELEPTTYGFRDSLISMKRRSAMYGTLHFDHENSQVIVKGFFNWVLIGFALIWLIVPPLAWLFGYISFYEPTWLYFGLLFINLGIFYFVEYVRFSAVAEFAAQSWARKHINTGEG